jgi:hypothetical protein
MDSDLNIQNQLNILGGAIDRNREQKTLVGE